MAKKRRRRRRSQPRGAGGRYRRRRRAAPRRRRRRNPAYANPPRRRRRRARRNPIRIGRLAFPPARRIVAGVVGVAATNMLPAFVGRMLPQIPLTGAPGLAVRAVLAVVAGQVAGRFTTRTLGEDVAFGGLIAVANDVAQQYVYPAMGLGAYLPPDPDYYADAGMGAYLSPGMQVPTLPANGAMMPTAAATVGRLDPSNRL